MGSGNGFTRRGLFGAGAAGAAAVGVSACGDDYFEPATSHGKDSPNVLLIFTDSTRADYLGLLTPTARAQDAEPRRARARTRCLRARGPGGDADRPRAARAAHRHARLPVPQLGAARPAARPRLDPDPAPADADRGARRGRGRDRLLTDNPFLVGPRYTNFRRTLDFVKADFSQGAYRALNTPFKRPAPRSAIEKYLLPELCDTIEVGRLRSMVGWTRSTATATATTRPRA